MNSIKIKVRNKSHGYAIQDLLMRLGYKWLAQGKKLQPVNNGFIYARNQVMTQSPYEADHMASGYTLTTLDELYQLETKPSLEDKINELEYTAKGLIEAIAQIREENSKQTT